MTTGVGVPLLGGADFLRHDGLQRLLALLNRDGEETRIVGGAVRNALLGLPIRDVDLATTALPGTVMARATAAGFRPVPTGIEHGTVTVVVDGEPFEVTTLRADVETDGRHAKVRFGRSFADDALRRDFTVNALFATADGTVVDFTGGIADAAARRIRFIGDPGQRIREDFLRTLRFFRFTAAYAAGPLDRSGFDAAVRERQGLAGLSRERVWAELAKLLVAPRAADLAGAMSEAGLLGPLLGGVANAARLARLAAIEAVRGQPADPVGRLAALAVTTVEDAVHLRDMLRLSNESFGRLQAAARVAATLHGRPPPAEAELARLLFLEGRQVAVDATALAHADSGAPVDDPAWLGAADDAASGRAPRLPVSGAQVLARGIAAGPTVGAVLKDFQGRWIRAGFPGEPALLTRLLDEGIATVDVRAGRDGA